MYLIFPKYSTVFETIYIPKLSEKCTVMNNYKIWRTSMSRKDLSYTLHFAK